ncbi:MAG: cyclic nucleotide-binding domain-containing protein [Pseudomonadota bacterium]|nr:cyclic nucleotide-binding domain-containing protein [Pseudomonadota bacterium]
MGESAAKFEVAIVGSGPAGLSAGCRAAVNGMSHIVLEKADHASDTIFKFQKGKHVMATPDVLPLRAEVAFSMGSREEVLDTWNAGLQQHNVNIRYNAEVSTITGERGGFDLTLTDGTLIQADNVVLAIGLQGNLNTLRIPGSETATHLQYQLDDPDEYEHETIIVIGAGDAAIENALGLCGHNTVYIANRGDEFSRAKEANESAILAEIERGRILPIYNADSVRCAPGNLTFDTPDGEITVDCDRVIARLGASPPRRFVEACGVSFPSDARNALPEVSKTYESNVPGLYIVGALGGYPLIKQAINQGYEVIEYIRGNALDPADEPLIRERLKPVQGFDTDTFLAETRARLPIFAELNPLMLREMIVESAVTAPKTGETVFERGDYSNSVFTIFQGSVRIHIDEKNPDNYVVLEQGAFFGEMGLIAGRPRSATITSNSDDTILIETPRRTMLKLRASVPSLRQTMDQEAVVRQIQAYIASSLDRDSIRELAKSATLESYKKGQTLFEEGDEGDAIHLIRKGSVLVSKRIAGREVALAYRAAGNYVGEMALMSNMPRIASIKAAVDCETIKIDGEAFRKLMADHPALKAEVQDRYGERVVETEKMLEKPEAGSIIEFLMGEGIGEATDVLLIDESLCVGCDNCEKACAETHGGVSRLDREAGPTFAHVHVPTSCRHCEHPHCMSDCPPDAVKRDKEGEVYITDDCIGCGNCQRYCPYDVIQMAPEPPRKPGLLSWLLFGAGPGPGEDKSYRASAPQDARKTAVKCDMCKDISGGAACVRACPTGAAVRVKPADFMSFVMEHRGELDR